MKSLAESGTATLSGENAQRIFRGRPRGRLGLFGSGNGRLRGRIHFHWSVWAAIGMIIMIVGWVALNTLGAWWQATQDDWHYGCPRTFQVDAVVGHNNDSAVNPSHFLAINLKAPATIRQSGRVM